MTTCNLSARILVRILILLFSREMGRKSFTDFGLLILGSKVMKEPFILSKSVLKSKKS
jgi:hypothetical protein